MYRHHRRHMHWLPFMLLLLALACTLALPLYYCGSWGYIVLPFWIIGIRRWNGRRRRVH